MKLQSIATTLIIAGLSASAQAAQEFADFGLSGSTSSEGWYNLNNVAYPSGYGTHGTSTAAWSSAIASNFGSGDAAWNKVAGTSGYLGGASTNAIYTPSTPLGSFSISDFTPLVDLETVVFQLDFESPGGAFTAPVLSYNGGSQALAATFTETIYTEVKSGGMGSSTRYVYAYQWDLVSAGTINDFTITWTVPAQHSLTYGAELQQSDTFTGSAIPEPSAFAALAGLGVLGLAATRRRA